MTDPWLWALVGRIADFAREVNDYIIEAARKYPGADNWLLLGESRLGRGRGAREAERCAKSGLVGVGELHADTQGFGTSATPTRCGPLLEVANQYGLIITAHTSEPVGHLYQGKGRVTPEVTMRFIENARTYPKVRIICAHWGGGLPFYALMPEVKDALENVWFDTAASQFLYSPGVFPSVAALVGADKILPASDFPLIRFRRIRKQIEDSGMMVGDFNGGGILKRLEQ